MSNFRLFHQTKQDGLDCGDEVGKFLTEYLHVVGKRDLRLLYFQEGLYTERNIKTESNFWNNNPVPKLTDYVNFFISKLTKPNLVCLYEPTQSYPTLPYPIIHYPIILGGLPRPIGVPLNNRVIY